MNQSDASFLFADKRDEEIEGIYAEIRKVAGEGQSSLIYYPPTMALLKSVAKELEREKYWVKEVEERSWYNKEQIEKMYNSGKVYTYRVYSDDQGNRYYRKGIKIWWVKPGFWEYHF